MSGVFGRHHRHAQTLVVIGSGPLRERGRTTRFEPGLPTPLFDVRVTGLVDVRTH
jgi:hypothetical protein